MNPITSDIFIPFDGFYESWIDDMIDNEIEMQLEDMEKDFDEVEVKINREAIARAYVKLYEATLEEQLEHVGKPHLIVGLGFKELISPREYNFMTDRILGTVNDRGRLRHIYHVLCGDSHHLDRDIKEQFSSRSGFASFYDDFANNWRDKPLRQWDANELSVLLPYFGGSDFDLDLTMFQEDVANNVEVIEEVNLDG